MHQLICLAFPKKLKNHCKVGISKLALNQKQFCHGTISNAQRTISRRTNRKRRSHRNESYIPVHKDVTVLAQRLRAKSTSFKKMGIFTPGVR